MSIKRIADSFSKRRSYYCPQIRTDLDPFQYRDQKGAIYVSLRDPLDLSPHRILIPQDLFYLVRFFDGEHSLETLCEKYAHQFGRELPPSRLAKMIKKMDQSLLLENNRTFAKIEQLRQEFVRQQDRTPACAGSSYADNPLELEKELQHYAEQSGVDASIRNAVRNRKIKAMIAPHIDPRLGGHVYAATYQALQASDAADVYVILGISHQPTQHPFALTRKNFQTPFGDVRTEGAFVDKLLAQCNVDYLADELVHRYEHSIEFQTIFLKRHLNSDFKIVPVLASFSHIRSGAAEEQVKDFIAALNRSASEYDGSVCFIASVDFSHVGRRYGDAFEPDPYFLSKVEQFDRRVIDALTTQDVAEFERLFVNSNNMYNICGYPALRTLLGVLPPSKAHLLRYDNAIMDEQRSTVTFAGMIFI